MNNLLSSLLIITAINLVVFLVAYVKKTDKFTDLTYGLTFVFMVWYLFVKSTQTLSQLILTIMITVWGLRLAGYLFIRIKKIKKDERFDDKRHSFVKFGSFWLLQAVSIWIIMLPSIFYLSTFTSTISYIALFFWLIGFIIQTIADYQKFVFKNKHKGKFIKTGIWKYSRHPNYFGEMLMWWSVFLYSIPVLSGLSWLSIASPLHITLLLLFISGIPLLEKQHEKKYGKEYLEYKKRTSKLIPWFKK